MIFHQMDKVVAAVPGTVGSSAVTLTVDTLGYDHVSFVAMRASNAATTFASVLKIDQSNDNVTFSPVSGLVGGTDFTIAAVSNTNAVALYKIDVDTKAKPRYLRLTATPSASINMVAHARLSRAEQAPVDATEAGCIGWVVG
jgi:hypothetical protein